MSQALYAYKNTKYDEVEASGWQATQVSAISLMNFSGRIFIGEQLCNMMFSLDIDSSRTGLVSDFGKNKYDMPRSYSLVLVALFFFVSQVATATIDSIEHLWLASALLGLAHGSVFSLFPTVCLEWFGMRKPRLLSSESPLIITPSFQLTSRRTGVTCQWLPWLLATYFLLPLGTTLMPMMEQRRLQHQRRNARKV